MQKGFYTAHVNICSIMAHLTEFFDIVRRESFHVVGITETWLRPGIESDILQIDGYKFVRRDRFCRRGGGLGVYVKSNLKFDIIKTSDEIEQLWIKLFLDDFTVAFGIVYKPPEQSYVDFFSKFEATASEIMFQVEQVICVGDFNIDLMRPEAPNSRYAYKIFEGLGLKQLINEPTRLTDNSATMIDLILSNDHIGTISSGTIPDRIADHQLVFSKFKINTSKGSQVFKIIRDYKEINIVNFENQLESIPWRGIYDINDVDKKVEFITDNIRAVLNIHAPERLVRISKKNAPWLTTQIRKMMADRDKFKRIYRKNRNSSDLITYKRLRNQVTYALEREKKDYFSRQFSQSDRWKSLKLLKIKKKGSAQDLPDHINDPNKINNFFANYGGDLPLDPSILSYYRSRRFGSKREFNFSSVSEIDILNIIVKLKTGAMGFDGINLFTLNLCIPFLLPYITHVINFCIGKSVFPREWKKAKIIPVAKVTNPEAFCDLRPISILPIMSKILEKVLEAQLVEYVYAENVIPQHQSGFRRGHSSMTALSKTTDDIFHASDQGKTTALILLDYSRAFDSLNHELLDAILEFIGISPNSRRLIANFTGGRCQAVFINGIISSFLELNRGVPQGSILGPLLYVIYVSQFSRCFLSCLFHYYADDTQMYLSFSPSESDQAVAAINYDLSSISEFSKKHCLRLNISKSAIMVFGGGRSDFEDNYRNCIVVDGEQIMFQKNIKSLGLVIDQDLRFTDHINKKLRSAYISLKLIYQNRTVLSRPLKSMLCDSLVLSQLNYCDTIYGPCLTKSDAVRVQRLQNSCLRLIFGVRKFDHISHYLRTNGWLNMSERRYLHTICFFREILKTKIPLYLYNKITFRSEVHDVIVRSRGRLSIPKHSLRLFERSFSYQIVNLLNKLPFDILEIGSRRRFRVKIFENLISSPQSFISLSAN